MDEFKGMELFKDLKGDRYLLKELRNLKTKTYQDVIIGYYAVCVNQTADGYEVFEISRSVYKQLDQYLDAKTIQ